MKISRHTAIPLGTFRPPTTRFEHLHVDLIVPMPVSQEMRYAVTVVDRFTRWPEVFPVQNIEAVTAAKTLYNGWISRYGTPLRITTDQGRQFESQLFKELNSLLGCHHIRARAYHPQSNGMVERFHRQLKAAIRCHETSRWTEVLPTVLLGIRSAWKEDLEATSAELIFGEPLRLSAELLSSSDNPDRCNPSNFLQDLREHFRILRPVSGSKHGQKKTFIFKDLHTASHVFIRRGAPKGTFDAPYEGPFRVINRSNTNFRIDVQGSEMTVAFNRLKPAYIEVEEEFENPQNQEDPQHEEQPTTGPVTRYGRRVRFPERYQAKP